MSLSPIRLAVPFLLLVLLLLLDLCVLSHSTPARDAHAHHHHHHHGGGGGCNHSHDQDHHHHHEAVKMMKLPEELAEEEGMRLCGFGPCLHHDHEHESNSSLSGFGLWVNALGCSLLVSLASLICLILLPLMFVQGKPAKWQELCWGMLFFTNYPMLLVVVTLMIMMITMAIMIMIILIRLHIHIHIHIHILYKTCLLDCPFPLGLWSSFLWRSWCSTLKKTRLDPILGATTTTTTMQAAVRNRRMRMIITTRTNSVPLKIHQRKSLKINHSVRERLVLVMMVWINQTQGQILL